MANQNLSSRINTQYPAGAVKNNYIQAGTSTVAGWAVSGSVTVATTTSNLPRASTTGTGIQFAAGSSGDYAYYNFTLDLADSSGGVKQLIQTSQKAVSGYTAGDFKLEIYATTDSTYATGLTRQQLSTDSSSVTSIPNMTGMFRSSFDPSSTAVYCQLRIVRVAGTSTLVLSDIIVGPGTVIQGAAVGEWQSYSVTSAAMNHNGTLDSSSGFWWRRVGSEMEIKFNARFTTAGSGGSVIILPMPTGYSIDSSKFTNTSAMIDPTVGHGFIYNTSAYTNNPVASFVYINGTTSSVRLYASSTPGALGSIAGSTFTGANSGITGHIRVPIAEWAGSGTVNISSNDVEYSSNSDTANADDTTTTYIAYGPGGAQFANINTSNKTKRVWFQTPIQQTDMLTLEVYWNGAWQPMSAVFSGTTDATHGISLDNNAGSNYVSVRFGSAGYSATTSVAASAWSGISGNANYKWRVRKSSGGQAVGFGKATDGSLGLVNTYVSSTASTFVFNGSGGTSSSVTMRYQRLGDYVTLFLPAVSATTGTSSTTFTSQTALDSWARPIGTATAPVAGIRNNGTVTNSNGYAEINSSGIVIIYRDVASTAWTNSASGGVQGANTFTYYVGTGS